jgi:hypothetical protein
MIATSIPYSKRMKLILPTLAFTAALSLGAVLAADDFVVYEGTDGPGKGKHVVLLAGDEEYRSEEAMPMLGQLLSQRHGFKCTVLFSVDKDGVIDSNNGASLSHPEALDTADCIVMSLRFRHYPDDVRKHFTDAIARGIPIVGLRTSTHAFNDKELGKFGKNVLGEQWVSHWGSHKKEATKGIIEAANKEHAILRGVADVFGTTDVYEAYPPTDATILVRGQVLKGMTPTDEPADYKKKRSSDKAEQGVNDPMMPVAWTRELKTESGKTQRILCTTMGAASDLPNEGLRRLVVNGVFWGLGLDVPAKTNVEIVGEFNPTMYGFNGAKKGVKPADYQLKK